MADENENEVMFDAVNLFDCSFTFTLLHPKIGYLNGEAHNFTELSNKVAPLMAAGWFLVACSALTDVNEFVNQCVLRAITQWREEQRGKAHGAEGGSEKQEGQGEAATVRATEGTPVGQASSSAVQGGE